MIEVQERRGVSVVEVIEVMMVSINRAYMRRGEMVSVTSGYSQRGQSHDKSSERHGSHRRPEETRASIEV